MLETIENNKISETFLKPVMISITEMYLIQLMFKDLDGSVYKSTYIIFYYILCIIYTYREREREGKVVSFGVALCLQ